MKLYRNVLPLTKLLVITSFIPVYAYAADDEKQPSMGADQSVLNEPQNEQDVRSLDEWNYSAIYEQEGFRAEQLLDAKVFSPQDNEIGTMANIVLDQKNQIVTVIAEIGGMWNSGDRHVAIPWDDVEFFENGIKVPVREDNVEEYDLFTNVTINDSYIYKREMQQVLTVEEDVATGLRTWKISDIIDDYASMKNAGGYGYITDTLFSRSGIMQAIIVKPANEEFGQGPRAYPFYGYPEGWRPGDSHYILPYSREDVENLPAFEYEKYNSVLN
ncbi:PRC-barrel domain-containing protein [Vreelandella arcis]|uniref:PRC-barrel domain-containing protein n=1 Tax=Vreelandella arcis TaxID=416873 RepID=A0A1H0EUW3_9GAMM|nr:PRC-barrel domain-containing protein [Halomonas arcis]SDN86162.1 PRC-barrel domain-containing protein [Halomonas arcis]